MSKAEEYIRKHTKALKESNGKGYFNWLTPDDARRAIEIEKEEMIDKFCEWVKKNVTYIHPRKGTEECVINLGKFKEAMMED